MKDCIYREEAISICERIRDKTDNDDMAFALNWAIQSIKGIPAVDVRPVKRCDERCGKSENMEVEEAHSCMTCENYVNSDITNHYGYCWLHDGGYNDRNEFAVIDREKGCRDWATKEDIAYEVHKL